DLRARNFEAAVIFTTFSQNPLPAALLCHLVDIPLRLAHAREKPYSLLSDHVAETEPDGGVRHEVRRQLDLVAQVGARTVDERLSLRVPEATHDCVRRLLRERGFDPGGAWAVVHPGSTAASRRYPPERYADVVRQLVHQHGWQVILTGDAGERALLQ